MSTAGGMESSMIAPAIFNFGKHANAEMDGFCRPGLNTCKHMNTNWTLLQDSLEGLRKNYPKGFTSQEFSDATGCTVPVARDRIGKLIKAGRVKFAGHRPSKRMDGRNTSIPVYIHIKNRS
jgi:hypothetical protein